MGHVQPNENNQLLTSTALLAVTLDLPTTLDLALDLQQCPNGSIRKGPREGHF